MKNIIYALLFLSFLFLSNCNKDDETPKVCTVKFEIDDFDCSDLETSCSPITITVTSSSALGRINAFDYEACGETGSVTIQRANNGCIESFNQTCD